MTTETHSETHSETAPETQADMTSGPAAELAATDDCCGGTACKPESKANVVAYRPHVDIWSTESDVWLVADVPGATAESVDITVERNLLSFEAATSPLAETDAADRYREFPQKLFRRSFRLSEQIDRGGIEATVKNGVLKLRLPKAAEATPHKVSVTAG